MKVCFVLPVWGKKYCRTFLDFVVPSLLSPNNLQSLPRLNAQGTLLIFCDEATKDEINRHPSMNDLLEVVDIEFCPVDNLLSNLSHHTFQVELYCHQEAIRRCEATNAVLVVLNPDAIWSDGIVANSLTKVQDGYRVVAAPSLRVCEESTLQEVLLKKNQNNFNHPHLLVDIALQNLHPFTKALIAGTPYYINWAAQKLWSDHKSLIYARLFFAHVFAVYPDHKGQVPRISYDFDWIAKAVPDFKDYYVIPDSDQGVALSLTTTSDWAPGRRGRYPLVTWLRDLNWIRRNVQPHNLIFFRKTVKIHSGRACK